MTRELLESYKSMKAEIVELKSRLEHLKDDESLIDADTVLDYRSGHGIPKSIVGYDSGRYWRKHRKYDEKIKVLQEKCDMVEEWVEEIKESETRRIFRMAYLDGMSYTEIGRVLHVDRSSIGKRIKAYMEIRE